MASRTAELRRRGAEFIVYFFHWGTEYRNTPDTTQKRIAKELAEQKVDLIFGSHPHVLQSVNWVPNASDTHRTLVVWSMGNFLSNQRYEFLKRRDTEDGLIVKVDVCKPEGAAACRITGVELMPTWVYRHRPDKTWLYEILPVEKALIATATYGLRTKESLWRAENSLSQSRARLASSPTLLKIVLPKPTPAPKKKPAAKAKRGKRRPDSKKPGRATPAARSIDTKP